MRGTVKDSQKTKTSKIIYAILMVLIMFLIFALFVMGVTFNKEFFINYSADKSLEASTIKKIEFLQSAMFLSSTLLLVILFIFILFSNSVKKFLERYKNIIINIFILLMTMFLFLVLTEIALRLLISGETSDTSSGGPGSLEFNLNYVHLNNEGMRDIDFQLDNPWKKIRIIGLGDSFTFGSGIKNENNTYLKVLENKLNSGHKDTFQVFNFGQPGTDSTDQLKIFKEKALKYKPDIVILGYLPNDFNNIDPNIKFEGENILLPFGFFLRNSLYTFYFLETRMNNLLENLNLKPTYEEGLISRFNSSVNLEYNKIPLKSLNEITKQNNITLVMLYFPLLYNLQDYPLESSRKFVLDTGEELGIQVIDILEVYKNYPDSEIIVSIYDRHPNEFAHEIAAEYIFNELNLTDSGSGETIIK